MFFYHREENLVTEEHKSPMGSVFFIGGIGGVLGTAHYIFTEFVGTDALQLMQGLISGFCFWGLLSIGIFRAFEHVKAQNKNLNGSRKKIQYMVLMVIGVTILAGVSAMLGAVPLAFIDFVGGELLSAPASLTHFYTTLRVALLIGGCIGFSVGLLVSIGVIIRRIQYRWFLLCSALLGSFLGSSAILLSVKNFPRAFPLYGAVYGLFLGIALISHATE